MRKLTLLYKALFISSLVMILNGCAEQAPAQVVFAKPSTYRPSNGPAGESKVLQKMQLATTTPEFMWPVKGKILQKFSAANAKLKGIDIAGFEGTPILAAADGEVVYSGNALKGYGNLIIIKHKKNILTAYAHNRKNIVKEGEKVVSGQRIAEMGRSGTDRVKLHFEVRQDGKPIDPQGVLPLKQ